MSFLTIVILSWPTKDTVLENLTHWLVYSASSLVEQSTPSSVEIEEGNYFLALQFCFAVCSSILSAKLAVDQLAQPAASKQLSDCMLLCHVVTFHQDHNATVGTISFVGTDLNMDVS